MLSTHVPYNAQLDLSVRSGKALSELDSLYVAVRDSVGKMVVRAAVFALLWPLLLLFSAWLRLKRRELLKEMRTEEKEFHSTEEYVLFRKKLDHLSNHVPHLTRITHYDVKKVHFVLRFSLKQMQLMCSTLLTLHGWLNNRFVESYNLPRTTTNTSTSFQYRTESELWKNRNKAYAYWM